MTGLRGRNSLRLRECQGTTLLKIILSFAAALVLAAALLLAAALVLLPVSAGAGDTGDIDALYSRWRAAVEAADIPAYVSVLHADVRLIPPGADPIDGRESYRQFLEPVFAGATYRIEVVSPPATTVLGDVAVSEYEYVIHLTLENPAEGITQAGALTASRTQARYFDVLRKDPEGHWKVWRHTWH